MPPDGAPRAYPQPELPMQRVPNQPFTRPARFSEAEWQARVQLAAAYRIFDLSLIHI